MGCSPLSIGPFIRCVIIYAYGIYVAIGYQWLYAKMNVYQKKTHPTSPFDYSLTYQVWVGGKNYLGFLPAAYTWQVIRCVSSNEVKESWLGMMWLLVQQYHPPTRLVGLEKAYY
jgi:hypothetical protein